MKKFLRRFFPFLIPILIGLAAFIVLAFYFTRPLSYQGFDSGLRIKQKKLLHYVNHKKIIFIGGSNVNMGINSACIQKAFPSYVVINYGHSYLLGLDYYLREIHDYIHSGDIVILIPEYHLINHENMMASIIFFERLHIAPLTNEDFKILIKQAMYYLVARIKSGLHYPNNYTLTDSAAYLSGYNKDGDNIGAWNLKVDQNRKPQTFVDAQKFRFKPIIVQKLAQFIDYCKTHDIRLLIVPPVFPKSAFVAMPILVQAHMHLFDSLGTPYITSAQKIAIDDSFFFDPPYHMIGSGVQIRTQRLIEVLAKVIPKNTPPPPDEIMNYYLV